MMNLALDGLLSVDFMRVIHALAGTRKPYVQARSMCFRQSPPARHLRYIVDSLTLRCKRKAAMVLKVILQAKTALLINGYQLFWAERQNLPLSHSLRPLLRAALNHPFASFSRARRKAMEPFRYSR